MPLNVLNSQSFLFSWCRSLLRQQSQKQTEGLHQKCRVITCLYMRHDTKAEDWHAVRGADDVPPRRADIPSGTLCLFWNQYKQRTIWGFCMSHVKRWNKGQDVVTVQQRWVWLQSQRQRNLWSGTCFHLKWESDRRRWFSLDSAQICSRSAVKNLWQRMKHSAEVSAGPLCVESARPGC